MKRNIEKHLKMIDVDPNPRLTPAEMAWVKRQRHKPGYPTIVWPGDSKADQEMTEQIRNKYGMHLIVFEQ
jgi:hypothetical protein